MAIRFDDKTKTFHLDTKNTTYQMKVDDYGFYFIYITDRKQKE